MGFTVGFRVCNLGTIPGYCCWIFDHYAKLTGRYIHLEADQEAVWGDFGVQCSEVPAVFWPGFTRTN